MGLSIRLSKPYREFDREQWEKYEAAWYDKLEAFEKKKTKQLEKDYQKRFDDSEKALERKDKALQILDRNYNDLQLEVDVLKEERDEVRDVVRQKLENEDLESALATRKELQDKREATLTEREGKIGSKEDGEYKKGYADGVADGVRKISEITQADRDNAMKIAMVAASSHTPVENMKEALSASRQLTEGTTNKES